MNDSPLRTLEQKQDRRGLLSLGLAALAGTLAAMFSRDRAEAGHDSTNVFHLGVDNTAGGASTGIESTSLAQTLLAKNNGSGAGVRGDSISGTGVQGLSSSGHGIIGTGTIAGIRGEGGSTGIGVEGVSGSSAGVSGVSTSGFGATAFSASSDGVHGESTSGTGVQGVSSSGEGVVGRRMSTEGGGAGVQGFSGVADSPSAFQVGVRGVGLQIGVRGEASPPGEGVFGRSIGGSGVRGESLAGDGFQAGFGVFGFSEGEGVRGVSTTGTGVRGSSTDAAGTGVVAENAIADGVALKVLGKARFSTAGAGTVPLGQNSVFVPNTAVTPVSHITVTLTSDPGPRVLRWVERSPGAGFTVHLTPAPASQRPATGFTFLIVEPV